MVEARCGGEARVGDRGGDQSHLLAEITRRIVQLHKQYFGKGPTKGRTYWQEDVITVVLREGLTPAEHTLREAGHPEAVTEQRTKMHEALREHVKREIGQITGREVIGFMSGIQQDPDMAAEVFVLGPPPDERETAASTQAVRHVETPRTDSGSVRARAAEQRRLAREQRDRAIRERSRSFGYQATEHALPHR